MLNPSDINGFKRLLAETVAWCTRSASSKGPKQSLRTLHRETIDLSTLNRDQLSHVADYIFQERRRLLRSGPDTPANEDLASGRLPNNFIQLAQKGIDVNPVESIQWASKFDNALTQALRSEGLI